eukprot:365656-Chlamydomonas_euryale.AAC.6
MPWSASVRICPHLFASVRNSPPPNLQTSTLRPKRRPPPKKRANLHLAAQMALPPTCEPPPCGPNGAPPNLQTSTLRPKRCPPLQLANLHLAAQTVFPPNSRTSTSRPTRRLSPPTTREPPTCGPSGAHLKLLAFRKGKIRVCDAVPLQGPRNEPERAIEGKRRSECVMLVPCRDREMSLSVPWKEREDQSL